MPVVNIFLHGITSVRIKVYGTETKGGGEEGEERQERKKTTFSYTPENKRDILLFRMLFANKRNIRCKFRYRYIRIILNC